jgi:hypothetical protein
LRTRNKKKNNAVIQEASQSIRKEIWKKIIIIISQLKIRTISICLNIIAAYQTHAVAFQINMPLFDQ